MEKFIVTKEIHIHDTRFGELKLPLGMVVQKDYHGTTGIIGDKTFPWDILDHESESLKKIYTRE